MMRVAMTSRAVALPFILSAAQTCSSAVAIAAMVSGSKAFLMSEDHDMANLLVDLSPIVVGWIALRDIQISTPSSGKSWDGEQRRDWAPNLLPIAGIGGAASLRMVATIPPIYLPHPPGDPRSGPPGRRGSLSRKGDRLKQRARLFANRGPRSLPLASLIYNATANVTFRTKQCLHHVGHGGGYRHDRKPGWGGETDRVRTVNAARMEAFLGIKIVPEQRQGEGLLRFAKIGVR
jgi:hypothetical protein